MTPIIRRRFAILVLGFACLLSAGAAFAQTSPVSQIEPAKTAMPARACRAASFEVVLRGGEPYTYDLGSGLSLRWTATEDKGGWTLQVTPKDDQNADYAYPLNPPLRSVNSQWLATGYGIPVRDQLSQQHDVRFILNAADYERIHKLMMCALWPCQPPEPNVSAEQYLDVISHTRSGLIRVAIKKFETSTDGVQVNWARVRIIVMVPTDFELAKDLRSHRTDCSVDVHAETQVPGPDS